MSVQTLELKPTASVTTVLKLVKVPLKVPAWSVVLIVLLAGVYGYVAGRQNPMHHYVPYVGYPLVLDTTTGKACYSSAPKPSEDAAMLSADANGNPAEPGAPSGPPIPLCGK